MNLHSPEHQLCYFCWSSRIGMEVGSQFLVKLWHGTSTEWKLFGLADFHLGVKQSSQNSRFGLHLRNSLFLLLKNIKNITNQSNILFFLQYFWRFKLQILNRVFFNYLRLLFFQEKLDLASYPKTLVVLQVTCNTLFTNCIFIFFLPITSSFCSKLFPSPIWQPPPKQGKRKPSFNLIEATSEIQGH